MLIPAFPIYGDSHYEALTIVRSPDYAPPEKVALLVAVGVGPTAETGTSASRPASGLLIFTVAVEFEPPNNFYGE
jgi:hypothetical protein